MVFFFFLFKWFFSFFCLNVFFFCLNVSFFPKKRKNKSKINQSNKTMLSVFMFPSSRLKKTFIHPLEKKKYVPFSRPFFHMQICVYHPPALFWYKESVDLFSYTFLILFFWYSFPFLKVFIPKK